jgi:hypothetical protein
VCHPGATDNFSVGWMSHYIPLQDTYPVVYFVNIFYQLLIPTVLGGMAILVVLDISSVFRQKRRKSKTQPKPPTAKPPIAEPSTEKPAAAQSPVAEPSAAEPPTEKPAADDATQESSHD